ncbi:lipopolysaccharide biosynthesis protein [Weissella confusa]
MEKSLNNSIKNALVTVLGQVGILLSHFIIQTLFIWHFSKAYIGANGLFTNLVSFLSFAELGIGTALTFTLYQPLARKDFRLVAAYMRLLKKVYTFIGVAVFIGGSVLTVFIYDFVKNGSEIPNMRLLFFLFMLNSAVSYFLTYQRTLLIADQKSYVDTINRTSFLVLQATVQVVMILVFQSYLVYLLVQILGSLASNIAINLKVKKMYSYIDFDDYSEIPADSKSEIKKNVVGAFATRLGNIVAYSTDNIIISKFLGLAFVGVYSNYVLILKSLQNLVFNVSSSVVATIAKKTIQTDNKVQNLKTFFDYLYLIAAVDFVLVSTLASIIQGFIHMWAGKSYLLTTATVLILLLNWFISVLRFGAANYITVYGLFWETKYRPMVEALVNIVVSVSAVTILKLGVFGVVLGTLVSNILVNVWWEPLALKKSKLGLNMRIYFLKFGLYTILGIIIIAGSMYVSNMFYTANIVMLLIKAAVTAVGSALIFVIITFVIRMNEVAIVTRVGRLLLDKLR